MEGRAGGGLVGMGWAGKGGRGVDTFEWWRHLIGVYRDYSIYIILLSLKLASPSYAADAPSFEISPSGGRRRGKWN